MPTDRPTEHDSSHARGEPMMPRTPHDPLMPREVGSPTTPGSPHVEPPHVEPRRETTGPVIDVVLGSWLFISAFLWEHGQASFTNTWVSGALLAIAGLLAPRSPMARSACGAIALWLVVSTMFIAPQTALTFWNNVLVGLVALVMTFMPQARRRARRARARAA